MKCSFGDVNHRHQDVLDGFSVRDGVAEFRTKDGRSFMARSPEEAERKIELWKGMTLKNRRKSTERKD